MVKEKNVTVKNECGMPAQVMKTQKIYAELLDSFDTDLLKRGKLRQNLQKISKTLGGEKLTIRKAMAFHLINIAFTGSNSESLRAIKLIQDRSDGSPPKTIIETSQSMFETEG